MIGNIWIGKSFHNSISYCLEDKKLRGDLEQVMKNRAEIVSYNLCFGNKTELIQQFGEVRRLNRRTSKPVLHISLSLARGEKLLKGKLMEISEECAKHMEFEKNQYIAVLHTDTKYQHIHIVANRIGFDGTSVKNNYNYRRLVDYCRKMELKYDLKQVLSPWKFLPRELRQIPRHNERNESVQKHVQESLSQCLSYMDFEKRMQEKGYRTVKGRGICFLDQQKVKVKGSDIGFSLKTVEKLLLLVPELRTEFIYGEEIKRSEQLGPAIPAHDRKSFELFQQSSQSDLLELKKGQHPQAGEESRTVETLLQPELQNDSTDGNLLKKKKQQKHSPRL